MLTPKYTNQMLWSSSKTLCFCWSKFRTKKKKKTTDSTHQRSWLHWFLKNIYVSKYNWLSGLKQSNFSFKHGLSEKTDFSPKNSLEFRLCNSVDFCRIIPVYMVYISCICSQVVFYNVLKVTLLRFCRKCAPPTPLPEHTEARGISVLVLSHVTVSCVHWEQTYCGNDINTAERLTKYYQKQTLLQNP